MENKSAMYSECVSVALVTQHTMHMHCGVFISVSSPAVTYFFTSTHIWHKARKNLLNIECVFDFLYNFSLRHVILRRTQEDVIINAHRSSCKVPPIHVRF